LEEVDEEGDDRNGEILPVCHCCLKQDEEARLLEEAEARDDLRREEAMWMIRQFELREATHLCARETAIVVVAE
jgi:hypothetical protein